MKTIKTFFIQGLFIEILFFFNSKKIATKSLKLDLSLHSSAFSQKISRRDAMNWCVGYFIGKFATIMIHWGSTSHVWVTMTILKIYLCFICLHLTSNRKWSLSSRVRQTSSEQVISRIPLTEGFFFSKPGSLLVVSMYYVIHTTSIYKGLSWSYVTFYTISQ